MRRGWNDDDDSLASVVKPEFRISIAQEKTRDYTCHADLRPVGCCRRTGRRLLSLCRRWPQVSRLHSGIAVTSLGHCHPRLIEAVTEQSKTLWHVSNLFNIPGQQRLAERLVANSFATPCFFNNSGAEAVELSIKVARKYQSHIGHPERYRVIGCHGSFHGASFATLAAAGAEAYLKGFGPPMDGFDHVAFNNLNEMRAAVTDHTAAILVEPVQGEGGVRAPSADYLKGLRAICDEFGLLLVYDEVQCGMGRTGKLFAHEGPGSRPTSWPWPGVGNGFPIAPASPPRRRRAAWWPARTARRLVATRWPWPAATPCST